MKLISQSFADGERIPVEYAFGEWNPESKCSFAGNKNPHFSWSDIPEGAKSFAIICHDPDVPSKPDDVNQEGRTVPASLPRVDFFHWVMTDIPASKTEIAKGEFSEGVTPRGKSQCNGIGLNNYTQWFSGDADMEGEYFGYDGPCPPWNDELDHRYVFTVYALDVESLNLSGSFDGPSALKAMQGHVLGQAQLTGLYAINPSVSGK